MYTLLILFFTSLVGIIVMIGRKLVLLQNGETLVIQEEVLFEFPDFREWRQITTAHIKKYGRVSVVTTLRFYLRSTNLLKNKYAELKNKTKNIGNKRSDNPLKKAEVSKFLKMVSEYKEKIREIKHQIKEEENL